MTRGRKHETPEEQDDRMAREYQERAEARLAEPITRAMLIEAIDNAMSACTSHGAIEALVGLKKELE